MSLRRRLLTAVGLAALVALGVLDGATWIFVTRAQVAQVDADLERAHVPIERAAASFQGDVGAAIAAVAPGVYVDLRAPDGQLLALVPLRRPGREPLEISPDQLPAPDFGAGDDEASYATVRTGSSRMRVRVGIQEDGSTLTIGLPLDRVDDSREHLAEVLALGTLAALALVGLTGAWFVRVGLTPLTAVERAAADVGGERLDLRVPHATDAGEVGELARTINRMLDRLDEAFRQRTEDLEALRASEARMRRFVADASHELRTPLAATGAYAELFERGARDHPEDLERAMRGIRDETQRMSGLVDDLLLLAQLDEGRPLEIAPVDLTEVAAAAVRAARVVAPDRSCDLVVEDVAVVDGDAGRLRQVVDNLLANVRVHTPPGTSCTVRVAVRDAQVVLEVVDDGPGVPADQLPALADRFHRVDTSRARASGGAGLGLSIVTAIVQAHHGSVTVDQPDGRGLRVTVRLPVAAGTPGGDHP